MFFFFTPAFSLLFFFFSFLFCRHTQSQPALPLFSFTHTHSETHTQNIRTHTLALLGYWTAIAVRSPRWEQGSWVQELDLNKQEYLINLNPKHSNMPSARYFKWTQVERKLHTYTAFENICTTFRCFLPFRLHFRVPFLYISIMNTQDLYGSSPGPLCSFTQELPCGEKITNHWSDHSQMFRRHLTCSTIWCASHVDMPL